MSLGRALTSTRPTKIVYEFELYYNTRLINFLMLVKNKSRDLFLPNIFFDNKKFIFFALMNILQIYK